MPAKVTDTHVNKKGDDQIEVKARVKGGKMRGRNVSVILDADDLVREQVGGFVNFLRENSIVGLAIGFVAGSQAQAVVKQLIADFIDPATKLLFGGAKLSQRTYTWRYHGRWANFGWGDMIYTILNLIIVLGCIYLLIRLLKLDRLQKQKDAK